MLGDGHMKYKVTYLSTHDPISEEVEADEHVLEEKDWFVFNKYLPGYSLTPILRIKAGDVVRIEAKQ
jgi:hypothetical protein